MSDTKTTMVIETPSLTAALLEAAKPPVTSRLNVADHEVASLNCTGILDGLLAALRNQAEQLKGSGMQRTEGTYQALLGAMKTVSNAVKDIEGAQVELDKSVRKLRAEGGNTAGYRTARNNGFLVALGDADEEVGAAARMIRAHRTVVAGDLLERMDGLTRIAREMFMILSLLSKAIIVAFEGLPLPRGAAPAVAEPTKHAGQNMRSVARRLTASMFSLAE